MQSENDKKPDKVFCCGPIAASIWFTPEVNGGKVVKVPSIKIDRSYQVEGQRRYSTKFFAEDLPKVALVATEAFRHLRLRSIEPDRPSEPL